MLECSLDVWTAGSAHSPWDVRKAEPVHHSAPAAIQFAYHACHLPLSYSPLLAEIAKQRAVVLRHCSQQPAAPHRSCKEPTSLNGSLSLRTAGKIFVHKQEQTEWGDTGGKQSTHALAPAKVQFGQLPRELAFVTVCKSWHDQKSTSSRGPK